MDMRIKIHDGNPLGSDGNPSDDDQELIDRIAKQLNQDVEMLYRGLDKTIPWADEPTE